MKLKMRKILKWLGVAIAAVFLALQFVQPAKTNPLIDPARSIQAHAQVTPEVAAIFERACRDCHSNQTSWPWYSHVAPVSWFVRDHVNHGRLHLNFDDWMQENDHGGRRTTIEMLDAICKAVKGGAMPLDSYTWLHPSARLSTADIDTLCRWTQAERERLTYQLNQ
jgi:hypothetical protein